MKPLKKILGNLTVLMLALAVVPTSFALTFPLPPKGSSVVGEFKVVRAKPGDTLAKIGQRYDIGYYEMVEANPKAVPDMLFVGERITIPSRFILPDAPRKGMVINLDELRLYFYPPGKNVVMTFPLGIGREGWDTPQGKMKIIQKKKDPTWYVPASIRKWRLEEHGVELPKTVPPGPDNPLGNYMMRLSDPSYLIHGTNEPEGVGRRVSSGCLRMYPDDIETLYSNTKINTPVNIISEPYKAGWQGNRFYVESHLPLQEHQAKYDDPSKALQRIISKATKNHPASIDWEIAELVAKENIGIPQLVGGASPAVVTKAKQAFEQRRLTLKGYKDLPEPFSST